jgi:hypothetical protein
MDERSAPGQLSGDPRGIPVTQLAAQKLAADDDDLGVQRTQSVDDNLRRGYSGGALARGGPGGLRAPISSAKRGLLREHQGSTGGRR